MHTNLKIASVVLALLACTTPAFADCTDILAGKAASGYLLKDVGAVASTEGVVQGDAIRTCGHWTGDLTVIAGPQGGTADEVDLSGFYDTTAGPVKLQASAQYYALNLHNSLGQASDDLVELYIDASVPLTRGRVTVAPMVRTVQMIGLGELRSLTLVQPGVRVAFVASSKLSLNADLRDSVNLTQHVSTLRWSAGLSYQFTEHFSVEAGLEGTDRTRSVASIGFRYRR